MATDELVIRRPDDWHLHLRDGDMLTAVVPHTARDFGRAIVMPNLVPPVVDIAAATAYRNRIMNAVPAGMNFDPLMTFYMTESTDADEVARAAETGLIHGVKLYPAGATTNSDSGVRDIRAVYPVLERMAEIGLPLLIHGEVTSADVDIFDREARFIETTLGPLVDQMPGLRIVLEHITTEEGADFVRATGDNVAATITVHHLMINRNAMLVGGIKPHYYCLPVAKREKHRQALRAAATSGDAGFFLGTDSAPHLTADKESACGCAGMFTAPNAMACLAQVFEQENALHRLEGFASMHGPAFYGLPVNEQTMRLVRDTRPAVFPDKVETAHGPVTVFDPGCDIFWRVA